MRRRQTYIHRLYTQYAHIIIANDKLWDRKCVLCAPMYIMWLTQIYRDYFTKLCIPIKDLQTTFFDNFIGSVFSLLLFCLIFLLLWKFDERKKTETYSNENACIIYVYKCLSCVKMAKVENRPKVEVEKESSFYHSLHHLSWHLRNADHFPVICALFITNNKLLILYTNVEREKRRRRNEE